MNTVSEVISNFETTLYFTISEKFCKANIVKRKINK